MLFGTQSCMVTSFMKKVDDRFVDKVHQELDEKHKTMLSKNAKAKNFLICDLDINIYNSVDQASSAHDVENVRNHTPRHQFHEGN